MSKAVLLCIFVVLCLVCTSQASMVHGGPPRPGPGGLAAGESPISLWRIFDATHDAAWSDVPVPDKVLDALQAQHLIGFDARVLSGWRTAEVADLMAWIERGIWFTGDWSSDGLRTVLQGLQMTLQALDNKPDVMAGLLGTRDQHILLYQVCQSCFASHSHYSHPDRGQVTFDSNPDLISVLHETGHVVDYHLAASLGLQTPWWSEVGLLGLGWYLQVHHSGEPGAYYLDDEQDASHSTYNPREDFADTFAAWVLEQNDQPLPERWRPPSPRRTLTLVTILRGTMLQ
jgi:hypothetical protein